MKLSKYFSKEWKFYLTTNKIWDILIRIPCTYVGYKLMIFSRWLLKIGEKRCSYCGEEQNINTGLHMHVSKKGLRCGNSNKCWKK